MTAKAWGQQQLQKNVEEVFFQSEAMSLCLMVNRRSKLLRVIDFRAGPSMAKRSFVLSMAQREGFDKVYTLVERDEVATWVKLGFTREGNIPGFYKRSDAFLLGCNVRTATEPSRAAQSEMRLAVRPPVANDDHDLGPAGDDGEDATPIDTRAHDFAERTIVHGKKRAKELVGKPLPAAKVVEVTEADVKKPLAAALKSGRAMTAFEPFGRDVQRRYFSITAKGGYELCLSMETQACFGNAFLEMLTAPRTEAERLAVVSALRAMCDKLIAEGAVSCFAFAPSDDVALATAFSFNGFRRTGLLQNHLAIGDERKDAILWSKKLANPADE